MVTETLFDCSRYMNGEQPPDSLEDQNAEDENLCDGLKLMQVNYQSSVIIIR